MTSPRQTPAPPKRKRRLLVLAVVLLAGAGVGGYLLRRPRPPVVPQIATAGMDAEVVAAIDAARAGVVARPQSASDWGRFGMVLFAQDLFEDCPAVFAEAERLDPTDPRWPYFHGLALRFTQPDRAILLLERAASVAPDNFPVRLRLAEQYLKSDRTDEADGLFRRLLELNSSHPRALLGHGQILSRRGQWQEALAPLRAAAAHPTARCAARSALAEAYSRLGDAKAAEAESRLAAQLPPDTPWLDPFIVEAKKFLTGLQPRIINALMLGEQGQLGEALALSAEVLRDHPDSDEAHVTRAKLLFGAGRTREAEAEARRGLALNPDLIDAHYLLGTILEQRDDFEGAERAFRRAVELQPSHALAHQRLGACRLKLGNKTGAAESFSQALRIRPDLPLSQLEFGALLLENGQVEEAIAHLEQAARQDATSEQARVLLEKARAKAKP
jgi:tetratricopeptide (TPR) repeat protein